jgi:hypothetical protein
MHHYVSVMLCRSFFFSFILQARFNRPSINDTYDPGTISRLTNGPPCPLNEPSRPSTIYNELHCPLNEPPCSSQWATFSPQWATLSPQWANSFLSPSLLMPSLRHLVPSMSLLDAREAISSPTELQIPDKPHIPQRDITPPNEPLYMPQWATTSFYRTSDPLQWASRSSNELSHCSLPKFPLHMYIAGVIWLYYIDGNMTYSSTVGK